MDKTRPPNMPLVNARWERYARGLAAGSEQGKAFAASGFKKFNPSYACLLAKEPTIRKRVDFLVREQVMLEQAASVDAVKSVALTRQMILDELWDNAQKAKAAEPILNSKGEPTGDYTANWAASNRALELLGKELGMFIERSERGKPGEFDGWSVDKIQEAKAAVEEALQKAKESEKA